LAERLASLQYLSYHVVPGEGTAGVPRVKLRDNFAEHHDGGIMHWLLFDTELADGFSREFIAPETGRPLERVEDSSGTQDT